MVAYTTNGDNDFESCFKKIAQDLLLTPVVDTGHWQAVRGVPQTKTYELRHVAIEIAVPERKGALASFLKPNIEWAEEHFQERVSGIPYNPPPSHVNWPYAQKSNAEHVDEQEKFSHTYPERLWSAEVIEGRRRSGMNKGWHGDLNDAVDLLLKEPYTRQCYIPIWFPQDLYAAAVSEERVPCTLGYHMMMRSDKLHCFYPMRSLDLLRYARDDLYMAGRLMQWVIAECRNRGSTTDDDRRNPWNFVQPGKLTLFASSLHIFEQDKEILKHRYGI